jgi:glutaconyl-CoA decarboxylase
VKEKDSGRPLKPIIEKMNALAQDYYNKSRPAYCGKMGLVDEIVSFPDMRKYMVAFAGAVYQNPRSICPHHHMMIPRLIKG